MSNDELRNFFGEIVPDFDRDRVYPSDIRKLLLWYNLLIEKGITDFNIEEESEDNVKSEEKKEEKHINQKQQVKTQKSAATSVKTGVGAKRG